MKRGLVVLLLLAQSVAQAAPGDESTFIARRLDRRVADVVARYRVRIPALMTEQKVPGVAVALVFENEIAWAEGFGHVGGPGSAPVTPDTLFSLQSISKTYTATAIMRAVDEGRLSLDAPITDYLPSFTVHSAFEEHPERKITLRLLLAHRAGFTHEAPVGNNYERVASFDEHVASIGDSWLKFPVGQRYSYSNTGIDLAGHVLEVAYGKPFATVIREQLFTPLGLARTTVDIGAVRESTTRAFGHARGFDNPPVGMAMIPAGGVWASARDVARFMRFHLRGGKDSQPPIRRKVLRQMYEPCCAGRPSAYGLGIGHNVLHYGRSNVDSLGHSGGGDGFLTDMYWYPNLGLGIAVLTNSDDHKLQLSLVGDISSEILAAFLGRPVPPDDTRIDRTVVVDAARQKQLAGLYLANRDMDLEYRDTGLCLKSGRKCYDVAFTAPDTIAISRPPVDLWCRFFADRLRDPAYATCDVLMGPLRIVQDMPFNGSPFDPAGPGKPEWNAYLGTYELWQWGKPVEGFELRLDRGWLTFGKYRVVQEYEPGLFFLADGEALDLRRIPATWRNIPLVRRPR